MTGNHILPGHPTQRVHRQVGFEPTKGVDRVLEQILSNQLRLIPPISG